MITFSMLARIFIAVAATSGPPVVAPRAAVSLALSLFDMDFPGTGETLLSNCEQPHRITRRHAGEGTRRSLDVPAGRHTVPLMYHLRVKICGITNDADGRFAALHGADAIGLNFSASSPPLPA